MNDRTIPIRHRPSERILGAFVCDRIASENAVYRSNFENEIDAGQWAATQVEDYYALLINGNIIRQLVEMEPGMLERIQGCLNASIQQHSQRIIQEDLEAA